MRAVITVVGRDRVGILASVSAICAENGVNCIETIAFPRDQGRKSARLFFCLRDRGLLLKKPKQTLKTKRAPNEVGPDWGLVQKGARCILVVPGAGFEPARRGTGS